MIRRPGTEAVAVIVAFMLVCGACASSSSPTSIPSAPPLPAAPTPPPTLFERLGGLPAIELVVDDFLRRVVADDRINHRFGMADLPHLRRLLVEQLCAATGGPCTYSGRDMKTTHRGQRIDEAAWTALVEDLVAAIDGAGVDADTKNALLASLAPMHDDIVAEAP